MIMGGLKKNSISGEWKDILQFLDINSQDYYFFLDIREEVLCFSNKMKTKISSMDWKEMTCLVSEWEKNIYIQDRPQFWDEWEKLRSGKKKEHNLEYRIVNWGGEVIWVNSSGKVETDQNGIPTWIFGRISENKLQDRADQFTGAFGIDAFKDELSRILTEQRGGFFLLVGVDGLKSINMKNGWNFGDEILKLVVRYLEEITEAKKVYRVNGDCFAVNIMKDSEEEIKDMFSRLQQYLEGKCTLSGGCVPLLKYSVPDVGTLFQYAENSLDSAKSNGKNMLSFFSVEDYEKNLDELELKEELTQSVKNGFKGFKIYYQPQMYTDTLKLYGAEALLRYESAKKGLISPSRFISLLEETGLIHSVGIWILETAFAQCKKWRKSAPDFHISINMSCSQLFRPDIEDCVVDCVKKNGIPSGCMTIEITESMYISGNVHINEIFARWKKEGIRISMDDFGTGYSSLSRLRELNVDEIKIDRCFVKEIQKSVYNHHLIGNMIELAENRNIDVCCEGVETLGELAVLKELGPKFLQGYLFAQPCSPEQFELMYFGEIAKDFRKRLDRINQSVFQRMSPRNSPIEWLDDDLEKNILDNLNDVIYVSDIETYELYYLNKAGKKVLNIKEYEGRKCYSVLQGKNAPCDFCTNHLLSDKKFYEWERNNDYCGHRYFLKDKQINSNGRKLRLEIAVDVTKVNNLNSQRKQYIEFSQRIGECAHALAFGRDEKEAAENILEVLASQYGADRVFVLEKESDEKWLTGYEWNRDKSLDRGEPADKEIICFIQEHLNELKNNHIVSISEQVYGQEGNEVKEEQSRQRVKQIVIPLFKRGSMIAALCIDRPELRTDQDSEIRVFADILSIVACSHTSKSALKYWGQLNSKNILELLNVGLWVIRYTDDAKLMFMDSTMCYVVGKPDLKNPQANYKYWYNRICNGYYQYVDDCLCKMVESWQSVQFEYTWQHPEKGEVVVQCTGIRIPDQDGHICLKGYLRIVSDIDQKNSLEMDSRKIVFEYNEKSRTALFHCGSELVENGIIKETNFPQCWIDREMVHPGYIWKFYKNFSLLRIKERFDDLEIPLKLSGKDYEWYVVSQRHLSKADKDLDTVVVTIEPFGEYRRLRLQYQRTKLFYQAVLSETIAYAEIELESGRLKDIGGIWKEYEGEIYQFSGNCMDFIMSKLSDYLMRPEIVWLERISSADQRKKIFGENGLSRRFVYQRNVKGRMTWVEFVCHLFRGNSLHDTYLLLYLKDINDQKEREIKQIKAAMEDDLTHVLNHTSFEEKVTQYIASDCKKIGGAFILFDMDNFKLINDNKGHLAGDRALKIFAELLKNTFGPESIIGRIGGDEFIVFVKGVEKSEEIEDRIQYMLNEVKRHIGLETSCSVGVSFVKRDNFDYIRYLRQADIAMYRTKKRGKDGRSYYKENGMDEGKFLKD